MDRAMGGRAVRTVAALLLTATLLTAWAAPAAATGGITAGTDVSHDFGTQRVATTSTAVTLTIPRTLTFADLPADGIAYFGGDATTDLLLGALGLPVPLTWGDLATAYPNTVMTYQLSSSGLQIGTQFQAGAITCGADRGTTCTRSLSFAPTQAGAALDHVVTSVSDVQFSGGGLGTSLANVVGGSIAASAVHDHLGVTLEGTGVRPGITARAPDDGAVDIARDVRPAVTFTKTMNAATITSGSLTLRDLTADSPVVVTVSFDGVASRATLTPAGPLEPGHHYRVAAAATITDDQAVAIDQTSWEFTVSSDGTPPVVTGSAPAPGATTAAPSATIVVRFSEALRPTTVTTKTVRLVDPVSRKAVRVKVTWQVATKRIVIDPVKSLAARHAYQVRLASTIRDVAGNPLASTSWSFRTR